MISNLLLVYFLSASVLGIMFYRVTIEKSSYSYLQKQFAFASRVYALPYWFVVTIFVAILIYLFKYEETAQ